MASNLALGVVICGAWMATQTLARSFSPTSAAPTSAAPTSAAPTSAAPTSAAPTFGSSGGHPADKTEHYMREIEIALAVTLPLLVVGFILVIYLCIRNRRLRNELYVEAPMTVEMQDSVVTAVEVLQHQNNGGNTRARRRAVDTAGGSTNQGPSDRLADAKVSLLRRDY
ncbi:hypothetical protein AAMO2058_000437700 [Amorphochlora amoebiformis]